MAHGLLALDAEETVGHRADALFRSLELGAIGARARARLLAGEVVPDRVGDDEITVGQTLHERARAEAVGAVVGEIGLAEHEEPGDVGHQVVVHPEAAHRVVHGGVDAHRRLVPALGGDLVVNVEEITVALAHPVFTEAANRVREIQIHAETGLAGAAALVTHALGGARGDVARGEIAEAGIHPLEIVVAVSLGDAVRVLAGILFLLRRPDAAVVAERFRHQRELRLVVATHGDARGVDLRVAGIRQARAALVSAPDRGGVGLPRIGREIEDIAVPARGEHHGIGAVAGDFAGHQVAHDDALRVAVDDDEVQHLGIRVQLDEPCTHGAGERGVSAKEELLAGLTARVKGARDLRAAEGAVGEEAAVLAGEGHALRDALVDDVDGDLGEAVHVGLAGAVVAALERVVEQPIHAVAVVLVVLRGVDAALRSDGVGAAWAVVKHEALHLVAHVGQRRGGG